MAKQTRFLYLFVQVNGIKILDLRYLHGQATPAKSGVVISTRVVPCSMMVIIGISLAES